MTRMFQFRPPSQVRPQLGDTLRPVACFDRVYLHLLGHGWREQIR